MEQWDVVKLYSRAMRSGHYVEAMCFGYQNLEYILEVLLTFTTTGRGGKPLSKTRVRKADNLKAKAELAHDNEFIDDRLFEELLVFNKLRAAIIHSAVSKCVSPEDLKRCAEMIGPLYKKIQDIFLPITVGNPEDV